MTAQTAVEENGFPATGRDNPVTDSNDDAKASNSPPTAYDLRLFKSAADRSQFSGAGNAPDFSITSPDPQKEALKHKVAEKLIAGNARLQIWQPPFEHIAHFEQISVEQARRKYRDLELRSPEGGNGLQIALRDDDVTVVVPLWHKGCRAAEVFRELWSYLQTICREAGYVIYDPQLDQTLEPATHPPDEVLARYKQIARQLRGVPAPVSIRLLVASQDYVVFVAEGQSGTLCGFAEVSIHFSPVEHVSSAACLRGWYVDPQFRGRGVGRTLLESAGQWAVARGLKNLASAVSLHDEQSVQAHLACGFSETSRVAYFIQPIPLPVGNAVEDDSNVVENPDSPIISISQ